MRINPNTGKGWTDAEEAVFADIMGMTRAGRIPAIQLFRRCGSNASKAIIMARKNRGLSDRQLAAYESTKAARLAGLAKANTGRAQDRPIQRAEATA